jgi:lambda family phage portal protein
LAGRKGMMARVANWFGYDVRKRPPRPSATYHNSAAMNRLTSDWVMMGGASADQVVRSDMRSLRDRARAERRDNPWVARYTQLQRDGILGAHGVMLRVAAPNTRGGVNEQVTSQTKSQWSLWCQQYADASGRLTLDELAASAIDTWKTEGEAFLQIVAQPIDVNPFGVALLALDADQVDERHNRGVDRTGTEIRMGVEIDRYGRRLAYHVWSSHPDDGGRERTRQRIPAEQMIHLGRGSRPGQTRFLSPLAPVLQDLRHLRGMQEGVLVLQRTAACKMGFLVPNESYRGPIEPDPGQDRVQMEAEAGLIDQLPPGFDFQNWDPGLPGDQYDPFTRNVLRSVAAGLGVSYGSLTGDLSDANYSSQRVGMLLEREGYRADQQYMINAFYRPAYTAWAYWSQLTGAVRAPADVSAVKWQPRGFPWIDPQKDAVGDLTRVAAGIDSLTRQAQEQGRTLEEVMRERADEIELAKSLNVPLMLPSTMVDITQEPADPAPAPNNNPARALRVFGD